MSLFDGLIEADLWLPPPVVPPVTGSPRREIWICWRKDGGSQLIFGAGTQDDPYDGSTYQKFDKVMATMIPAGATVRLGPGTFETKGGYSSDTNGAWRPESGWRIIGSGMWVTTLKLVEASTVSPGYKNYYAIGAGDRFLLSFEVSDLTIDCNIKGTSKNRLFSWRTVQNWICRVTVLSGRAGGPGVFSSESVPARGGFGGGRFHHRFHLRFHTPATGCSFRRRMVS